MLNYGHAPTYAYISDDGQNLLRTQLAVRGRSRRDNDQDKASMECFFGLLEREWLGRRM